MAYKQMTPSDVVIENVKVYMRWRDLNQEDLADRMTMIGMGFDKKGGGKTTWHRRTVGQMLNGHRRIDVNELFGLALALETTVGALLSPLVAGIANFNAEYRIADLEPLHVPDYQILLRDLQKKESRPRLVLGEWPTTVKPEGRPKWEKEKTKFEEILAGLLGKYMEEHPGVDPDEVSGTDMLDWMEEGAKGDDSTG